MKDKKDLLIISCSKSKIQTEYIKAINLYQGNNFKIIHKAQREGEFNRDCDILILSAYYGFVHSDAVISYYDQFMSRNRANSFKHGAKQQLQTWLAPKKYNEVFISLGKNYAIIVNHPPVWEFIVESSENIIVATGGIGMKSQQLKNWIRRKIRIEDAGGYKFWGTDRPATSKEHKGNQ